MPARPLTPLLALILLFALIVTLFPIFWIVMTAIKPPSDWNVSPAVWVPSEPTLINFRTLFDPEAIGAYGVTILHHAATALSIPVGIQPFLTIPGAMALAAVIGIIVGLPCFL